MSIYKKAAALLLTLALAVSVVPAARAAQTDTGSVISDVAAVLLDTVKAPGVAQTGGDWTIIALRRAGVSVPEEYYQLYYDNAVSYIRERGGVLSTVKNSEYSRVALATAALGADPSDVGGYDLIKPLTDLDATAGQGINGPVFALLALAATGKAEAETCDWYIDYILSKRLPDGGFAMSGEISDPDTTAIALTALSAYAERADVSEAIGSGLDRLSRLQRDTGGFTSYSVVNSESVSQVIIAISTLGIPLDDTRFVKNGNSLLDNLMTYYIPGEGFEHEPGLGVDLMATEQALLALAAVHRQQSGLPALYDLSDASPIPVAPSQTGLPGKHPDIAVPDVTLPGASFDDISGIAEEDAILALARRGIVDGYPGGSFAPDNTLTRAGFAAIITRALGLAIEDEGGVQFKDVAPGTWYYNAICTASVYHIIQGRDDGTFDPDSTLTRQEAAVMTARAAMLCGIKDQYPRDAARNILSQFTDYRQIADWALSGMAFCYDKNLLDQSDIETRYGDAILRREMAELTYRLLAAALLID